jgi:tripartite-type tricarboxylate transporter receptor subunit TctC
VPLLFSSMDTAIPFEQSGKIIPIAVTSSTRASALPDVRTMAEQGLAGFEASLWFAVFGSEKLPAEIVAKLSAAQYAPLNGPAVQAAIRGQGYEPQPGTPADFTKQLRFDDDKWGKVIRDAKISVGTLRPGGAARCDARVTSQE